MNGHAIVNLVVHPDGPLIITAVSSAGYRRCRRCFNGRVVQGNAQIAVVIMFGIHTGGVGVGQGVIGLWEDGRAAGVAWGGPFPTQADFGMLQPHTAVCWEALWYPVRGTDGIDYADTAASISLRRVERTREQDHLVVTAIAGPGKPFVVRWKPQVEPLDAKLVVSSEANTVATVSAAALRIDSLFVFDIAQGKLSELRFVLPRSLGVTQVRGADIRDWSVDDAAGPGRLLKVSLVRPQAQQYALHIIAEQPLPPFPCALALPVIRPADGIRAGGHLAVGTSSAIQLQVRQTSGLSQIDTQAFPRVLMDRQHPRALPAAKAFYYSFAASPYQLQVKLDDIVPSYDASHRLAVTVREDDLVIDALVTLDVRDAPIRTVTLACPAGYLVAAVTGALVDDYRVQTDADRGPSNVSVQFAKPVLGTTNLQLRLELGRGPLDEAQVITPIRVVGAKAERGELVVAAEPGVRFDTPETKNLREVNLANVESNVPHGRLAYKFRQADWSLALFSSKVTYIAVATRSNCATFLLASFSATNSTLPWCFAIVFGNLFLKSSPVGSSVMVGPYGFCGMGLIMKSASIWARASLRSKEYGPCLYKIKLNPNGTCNNSCKK